MFFISLIVAIFPIFIIGLYIYRKDREKESSNFLFQLFIGGIISCFPAIILGSFLGKIFPPEEEMNSIQLLSYVLISISFSEELCKWLFLYNLSYNHDEFDTLYDMIVYASFVALGFACFENILYVYNNGIFIGLLRAVTAVPGHVCDGILMGSYLSLAKFSYVKGNKVNSMKYKMFSLMIPIIVHGIYDFCLFKGNILFVFLFVIFVIALCIICIKKVKEISMNDLRFRYRNNEKTRF